MSIAPTAASTALPPSRSTAAPACAVSGCPAATTPLSAVPIAERYHSLCRGGGGASAVGHELGHFELLARGAAAPADVGPVPALGRPIDPDLARSGLPQAVDALAAALVAVAGGHHRDPDLVVELLVAHRAEDDVRVGMGGLR